MFGAILAIALIVLAVVAVAVGLASALSSAGKDADKNFSDNPVGSSATSCSPHTVWQWDPPYTSVWKQFANLPEDVALNCGPEPLLKGHIEPRMPGVSVTFTVVPNFANEISTSAASLSSASATTDETGEASVKIKLPQHGGLKFKLGGKTDSMAHAVDSGEITVWRKIEYTLACMKRSDGTDYSTRVTEATLVSEYAKAFIELISKGALTKPTHTLLVEQSTCNVWAAAELPAQSDRTMNFGLIDILAKDAPIAFTKEYNPPPLAAYETTYGGGSWAFDLSSKNSWLDSAVYYDSNAPTVANDIAAKITMSESGLDFKLAVDLSAIVSGGIPLNRMKVVLGLKKRDYGSGVSWGPITLVGMRWREAGFTGQEGNATMHTMLHEAGHYHKLVPNALPEGPNSYYYDATAWGVGGGPHCSCDVANPANSAALPATPKCLMYHEFRMTMTFCDKCLKALRAQDLTNP